MKASPLVARLQALTGRDPLDPDRLAGLFNRFRPDGAGLDEVFDTAGVEGEVLRRVQRVFAATAAS